MSGGDGCNGDRGDTGLFHTQSVCDGRSRVRLTLGPTCDANVSENIVTHAQLHVTSERIGCL